MNIRRLSTCNTYVQIETAPHAVAAYYGYGLHKRIEVQERDGLCHVKVLEQNGDLFRWSAKKLYLVGHMMYGISVSPENHLLFAQQDTHSGGMICYDLKTGEEKWRLPTRAEISNLFVGENTLCYAKSRKSLVLCDMLTGKQLAEHKTPFDNRFSVLTERAIFNHSHARTWEVLDPRSLRVLEEVKNADLMRDTGAIYRRLLAEYATEGSTVAPDRDLSF